MRKVLLMGDSIRMNYEPRLRELVGHSASIHSPDENCRFAAYTLFNLTGWAPDDDFDVIHWNNGQWDLCYMPDGRIHTPLPWYLEYEKRIAEILLGKGRRVIFATISPVFDDQFDTAEQNGRRNEDIVAYNRAVSAELAAMGVEINDLHAALAQDVRACICEDKVHLAPEGIERCARLVAAAIDGTQ